MSKDRNRWPKSIHCQCESVFHSIRSIRSKKIDNPRGIRAFGTWNLYRYEAHRFVEYMRLKGRGNILNVHEVRQDMVDYLTERLDYYIKHKRSRQTLESILSALGKFEVAINHYISTHKPGQATLDTEQIRKNFYTKGKKFLPKSSRKFDNRSFIDPIGLIEAIPDGTYQLQASLQFEGGLRSEGVGAPSNRRLKNPLTLSSLHGIIDDPVTGLPSGMIASKEKGGKVTRHFVSIETYRRLQSYIARHEKLESNYFEYVEAINQASRLTNQYAPGRGSHALKHNFAQERYHQCITNGLSHEHGLQQTALEMSHYRMRETLGYTRGKR